MNLSDILKKSLAVSTPVPTPSIKSEYPTPDYDMLEPERPKLNCVCGHPEEAHSPDCEVEECDCISFLSHSVHAELKPPTPEQIKGVMFVVPPETPVQAILDHSTVTQISEVNQNSGHSSEDITVASGENGCAHLCEKCNNWFSHGPKLKCRFPDLIRQGLCLECLNGSANKEVTEPLTQNDKGEWVLDPVHQIKIRNAELLVVKDMTLEQIQAHILYTIQMEKEWRARQMASRKRMSDLIEVELQDIPEAEREKFREALIQGRKPKAAKEKKSDWQKTLEKLAAGIASTAKASGKTISKEEALKKAEEALND